MGESLKSIRGGYDPVTDLRHGVAALDGAGAARRGGLAAPDLQGGGGRKKGQSSESEGGDAREHGKESADRECERADWYRPEAWGPPPPSPSPFYT